jgi:polyphosphate kinase
MAPRTQTFVNRELSWLEFNQRVLDEALDPDVPLLERLQFLSITASNLDEFFMVRVGGLKLLVESGSGKKDPSGMTPVAQLEAVNERAGRMINDQYACYQAALEPELVNAGIARVLPEQLNERQSLHVEHYFQNEVFPVVTPMAMDPSGNQLPALSNLALCVAVRLKPEEDEQKHRYAVIPVGSGMSRFVAVPSESGYSYMLIEDVIRLFVSRFFPGEPIAEAVPIRITRNADVSARDEFADDFISEMETVLTKRTQGDCVRLEVLAGASRTLITFFQKILRVPDLHVYSIPAPMDLSAYRIIAGMEGFSSLKYEPWPPQSSPDINPQKSMFEQIAQKDILLFHPYESFDPVVRFIKEAAADPNVRAIKQILYRTSSNSPIIAALADAAERGKYVTVVVELKARFDEARNIAWARELERSGVQVIYGIKGLKVHAKICIVVRREHQGLVRYLHFGTGNYNELTARIYSDASLFTRDPDLAVDASAFFNAISGYSQPQNLLKLSMAPINLRSTLLDLIRYETERRKHGHRASIMAKVNSLVDPAIIQALYEAAQAGVKIQLNVRGICCLMPGIEGTSENITVVSIVDRYLEHARIFSFYHGGNEQVFMSSADWMPRNLDRRIELMVPIEDPDCAKRLIAILNAFFKDKAKARRILPDGKYEYVLAANRKKAFRAQESLFQEARQAIQKLRQEAPTVLEPLRPPPVEDPPQTS